MSDPFKEGGLPRPALFGLVGLVAVSLLAVIIAQAFGYKAGVTPPSSIVEQRDLRFSDGKAGVVHVWDVNQSVMMDSISPGTENFVRGVLRGFARDRRSRELDDQIPFRLARHADGRLTIEDLATGRTIDLQAFGHTNVASFNRLLTLPVQAL